MGEGIAESFQLPVDLLEADRLLLQSRFRVRRFSSASLRVVISLMAPNRSSSRWTGQPRRGFFPQPNASPALL